MDFAPRTSFAEIAPGFGEVAVVSGSLGDPASDLVRLPSLADLVAVWVRVIADYCEWDRAKGGWTYDFAELPDDGVTRSFV